MADGVKVDLDALTTFARTVAGAAEGHVTSGPAEAGYFTALASTLRGFTGAPSDPPRDMCLSRPGHQFLEAQDFAMKHATMVASAHAFLADAVSGLLALSAGAETCAVRYADTDAANAAAQELGRAHVEKDHAFSALAVPVTGRAAIPADGVTAAFTPATAKETMPLPGTPAPTSGPAAAVPAATTRVPGDAAHEAEVAALAEKLRRHEDIEPVPAHDPGEGMTIGKGPDAVVVPPDTARMPKVLPMPKTLG